MARKPRTLRARGSAEALWQRLAGDDARFAADYAAADRQAGKCLPYQRAAIYRLARQYDRKGGRILELGTWCGNTAILMALAAPRAVVVTVEPETHRTPGLHQVFAAYPNIGTVAERSWDYLYSYGGPALDMIFVDGDHNRILLDLPWFNWLAPGGLILFHDYTPGSAAMMPCEPVYRAVNWLGEALGRAPDVLVVDEQEIGLAGFYRREGELWRSIACGPR